MGKLSVGQSVRRLEDRRFLTGHGRYIDDIDLPHQLYAYVLRSPHAHARLRGIDKTTAEAAPGVAAVVTGADLAAEGLGGIAFTEGLTNRDGSPIVAPPRPVLAVGKVRHVGDGVALVVAGTLAQARGAAELIAVEYDPLPAVTEAAAALAPGAPQIWDEAPGNLCLDWETGDRSE